MMKALGQKGDMLNINYCHQKWNWGSEFKSWIRLFVLLGGNTLWKGMNPSLFPQVMGTCRVNWAVYSWLGNQSRRKTLLKK